MTAERGSAHGGRNDPGDLRRALALQLSLEIHLQKDARRIAFVHNSARERAGKQQIGALFGSPQAGLREISKAML
eukprot:5416891-Pleurochrysis_carterae.AAC.1